MNSPPTEKSHLEIPLEENVNRITPDEGTVEARTIEDAIAVLRYNSFMIRVTSCHHGYSTVDWNEVSQASQSWPYLLVLFILCLSPARGLKMWTTTLSGGWKQPLPPMRRPTCLVLKRRTPTWGCHNWSNNWKRSGWSHQRTPSTNALLLTTQSECTASLRNFIWKLSACTHWRLPAIKWTVSSKEWVLLTRASLLPTQKQSLQYH